MISYAAYAHDRRAPLLLRDGGSFWAFVFGPFWLVAHAAWIPGLLVFLAVVIGLAVLRGPIQVAVLLGGAVLLGLHGQDLRGWHLRLRGWTLVHVVVGSDQDAAYSRLLAGHPEYQTAAAG